MKRVSAAEANRHFSRILREVAAGERVIVTSRGRPVAEIVAPVEAANDEMARRQQDLLAFLEELRARPAMNFPRATRDDMYE